MNAVVSTPLLAGLDLGSTTLKLAIVSGDDRRLVFSHYQRHRADLAAALRETLTLAAARLGADRELSLVVTGSAGLGLAEARGLPFLQETVAAVAMARRFHPQTRALLDIGGEDAKLVLFAPGRAPDIRMNGSCAGGTGAFLDQVATLLGGDTAALETLARESRHEQVIASRCGVFAKTDIQNLLSRGAAPADIAAAAFRAVAQQIVTTLARGGDLTTPLLLCGGPLALLPGLRAACWRSLGVSEADCLLPEHAALVPALGCAVADGHARRVLTISALLEQLTRRDTPARNLETPRLPPLFTDSDEYAQWRRDQERHAPPARDLASFTGSGCALGIDSGSTTTKIIALSDSGEILFTHYAPNHGDPLAAARDGLARFHAAAARAGRGDLSVTGSVVTGYGEDLLRAAFNLGAGLVETVAHYEAARRLAPDVSFILDIGGQDMKAVFVEHGAVTRLELNEACSAGCGAFMDGFARALNLGAAEFAALACRAARPCDLGTRCTVFMNSRVRQALRENAVPADLAAGLAYAVAKNCLYKVLKLKHADDLGRRIVVQGGVMRNHAVARALEKLLGKPVAIAPLPELMGAYGAAWRALTVTAPPRPLAELTLPVNSTAGARGCPGCENHCRVTLRRFAGGGVFCSGNRCEKIFTNSGRRRRRGANFFPHKLRLLFARAAADGEARRPNIGIPRALGCYENFPFWHTLLTAGGCGVTLSAPSTPALAERGAASVMADNICFPAKLAHGHVRDLLARGVDRILMPFAVRERDGAYNCPIVSGYADVIRSAINPADRHGVPLDAPVLTFGDVGLLQKSCREYLVGTLNVNAKIFTQAFAQALAAQEEFVRATAEQARAIVAGNDGSRPLLVLAGRPYHADPLIQHRAAELLAALGADVVSEDVARDGAPAAGHWSYPNRLRQAAVWVAAAPPHVQLVQLTSFGCGPDAFLTDSVGDRLRRAGKSHTVLKVDDMQTPGAVRLRARSLIESLARRAAPSATVNFPSPPAGKNSPSVKGCPRSGRGSSAFCAESPLTLNYPVGSRRHPFTEGEFADAEAVSFSLCSRVGDSLSVPGNSPDGHAIYTAADRDRALLVPFFSECHSPFIAPLLELLGHRAVTLPPPDAESAERGLRFANNEVCYPATLVAGDFIRALESGRHRRDQVALAITQTGGQCRATAYAALIRRAVSAAGFADVPVVAIGTAAGAVRNAQPGFRLRWRGCRRLAVAALFYADSLASMYHAAAPRETAPAVAARVRDHYLAAGVARVRRRDAAALPGLLRAAAREFNAVTPPSAPRPRVGVVGEIYVKHNAAGNRHLVEWLIAQGVEPVVPPLADFFLQEFFNRRSNREQHLSRLTVNDLLDPALRKVLELYREKFTRAAAGFRYHQPPDNLADGHAAATRIVSPAAQYGEGWLIPAELSALAGRGINHAVSVQPFGCIANQLVAKGIERRLRDLHPRLNLLCLDFDPGASEANIFNRLHFLIHGAREDLGAVGLPGGGNSKCQTPNAN